MKMEVTECVQTSAHKIQTPGNNPKEIYNIRNKFVILNNIISVSGLYDRSKDLHHSTIRGCTHLMKGIKSTFFCKENGIQPERTNNKFQNSEFLGAPVNHGLYRGFTQAAAFIVVFSLLRGIGFFSIKLSALKESSRIWCLKTYFFALRNSQLRVIFNGEHYVCAYDTYVK